MESIEKMLLQLEPAAPSLSLRNQCLKKNYFTNMQKWYWLSAACFLIVVCFWSEYENAQLKKFNDNSFQSSIFYQTRKIGNNVAYTKEDIAWIACLTNCDQESYWKKRQNLGKFLLNDM